MYREGDFERTGGSSEPSEPYRTAFRKDSARLIHSPAFRRLQGKTQLFPGLESDSFRSRLTHSLEVGQIAKSISIRLNHTEDFLQQPGFALDCDLVEFAGWCHDLGHPPFGHTGEDALDEVMRKQGGFEGNAQTLRIVAILEKRKKGDSNSSGFDDNGADHRRGLDLCARSLAAVLKYDAVIPQQRKEGTKLAKGYYQTEKPLVDWVKKSVTGDPDFKGRFKTVECQIMDVADDIAYSTYDIEDALKAGFLSPLSILSMAIKDAEEIAGDITDVKLSKGDVIEIVRNTFGQLAKAPAKLPRDLQNVQAFEASAQVASDGYLRTALTSDLVSEFISNVEFKPNESCPALSKVSLREATRAKVEVLKKIAFRSLIMNPRLRAGHLRGIKIVSTLLEVMMEETRDLLPDDFADMHERAGAGGVRVICDFVAGMTDRYALEFYGRLTSMSPITVFKPL